MDWYAGALEEIGVYSFTVDDLALRECQTQAGSNGGEDGMLSEKPTSIDLARCRLRDPVQISGSLKRARLGPYCNTQDDDWEATTQALAATLESASLVMIENGANWKIVPK